MFAAYGDHGGELFKSLMSPPVLVYPYDTFHFWHELDSWEREHQVDGVGNRFPVRMSLSSTYHAASLLGLQMTNDRWATIKYIETIYFKELNERQKNGV